MIWNKALQFSCVVIESKLKKGSAEGFQNHDLVLRVVEVFTFLYQSLFSVDKSLFFLLHRAEDKTRGGQHQILPGPKQR